MDPQLNQNTNDNTPAGTGRQARGFQNLEFGFGPLGSRGGDKECPICHEDIEPDEPVTIHTLCNNHFHDECIDGWINFNLDRERDMTCPVCIRVLATTQNEITEEEAADQWRADRWRELRRQASLRNRPISVLLGDNPPPYAELTTTATSPLPAWWPPTVPLIDWNGLDQYDRAWLANADAPAEWRFENEDPSRVLANYNHARLLRTARAAFHTDSARDLSVRREEHLTANADWLRAHYDYMMLPDDQRYPVLVRPAPHLHPAQLRTIRAILTSAEQAGVLVPFPYGETRFRYLLSEHGHAAMRAAGFSEEIVEDSYGVARQLSQADYDARHAND